MGLQDRVDLDVKKRKSGWYVKLRIKREVVEQERFGLDQEVEAREWGRKKKEELVGKYQGRLITSTELKQYIQLRGVTLKQAARACGVSYASMIDYCNGLTPVREYKVKAIVGNNPCVYRPDLEREQLLESLKMRREEFPKEWLPDIDGMIARLERGRDGI